MDWNGWVTLKTPQARSGVDAPLLYELTLRGNDGPESYPL
jgi:hypothetical protein